jgi:hypothetical protein
MTKLRMINFLYKTIIPIFHYSMHRAKDEAFEKKYIC